MKVTTGGLGAVTFYNHLLAADSPTSTSVQHRSRQPAKNSPSFIPAGFLASVDDGVTGDLDVLAANLKGKRRNTEVNTPKSTKRRGDKRGV